MTCQHKRIVLFGSEETGLQHAECETCGMAMTRSISPDGGYYVYSPLESDDE